MQFRINIFRSKKCNISVVVYCNELHIGTFIVQKKKFNFLRFLEIQITLLTAIMKM